MPKTIGLDALRKKEKRALEAAEATADYERAQHAVREKTARLRALRLAQNAEAKMTLRK